MSSLHSRDFDQASFFADSSTDFYLSKVFQANAVQTKIAPFKQQALFFFTVKGGNLLLICRKGLGLK
jgi:hypothetical protein